MAESTSNFRRFSDNDSITSEELNDNDVFPMTQASSNEDKSVPYKDLKDRMTEDVFSNTEILDSLSPEILEAFGRKMYLASKNNFKNNVMEIVNKRVNEHRDFFIGGAAVEMTDSLGNKDLMFKVPKFYCEEVCPSGELGEGVFPAFIGADGEIRDCFYIGQYQASNNGSGIPVSKYNAAPWVNIDFDTSRAKCLEKGGSYHLVTNWEWAAVCYWIAYMIGKEPSGNVSSSAAIGTGTGGNTYAHNQRNNGIYDLVGNVWEWIDGIKKTSDEKIALCEVNDINRMKNSEDEETWIKCCTHPTYTTATTLWRNAFANIGNELEEGEDKDNKILMLKRGLVRPIQAYQFNGNGWYQSGESMLVRGGNWANGATAGLGAFPLDDARSYVGTDVGFRFARFD